MFGYITVDADNLKVKDYRRYEAFYCGICQELKEGYGRKGQFTLTYDMTFLAILLTGLYETSCQEEKHFCIAHPGRKRFCLRNRWTRYAADINILISYYNLLDDWEDEHSLRAYLSALLLKRAAAKVERSYPAKGQAIAEYLRGLHQAEAAKSQDPDLAAGLTGTLFAELFVPVQDIWSPELSKIGYFIGKYIYLMDAYDDVYQDQKNKNYNPFANLAGKAEFEEKAEMILTLVIAEAARAFEKLPVLEEVDILRNILYSGIWAKYDQTKHERLGNQDKAES